jgi:hypothetical protein
MQLYQSLWRCIHSRLRYQWPQSKRQHCLRFRGSHDGIFVDAPSLPSLCTQGITQGLVLSPKKLASNLMEESRTVAFALEDSPMDTHGTLHECYVLAKFVMEAFSCGRGGKEKHDMITLVATVGSELLGQSLKVGGPSRPSRRKLSNAHRTWNQSVPPETGLSATGDRQENVARSGDEGELINLDQNRTNFIGLLLPIFSNVWLKELALSVVVALSKLSTPLTSSPGRWRANLPDTFQAVVCGDPALPSLSLLAGEPSCMLCFVSH